jgi:hypothetical protein
MPIKKRIVASPAEVSTNPIMAVGIALTKSIIPIGIRGPNLIVKYELSIMRQKKSCFILKLTLSQKGPNMKRMIIVPETAEIDEFHISASEMSSVSWTSFKRGEIENLCNA